MDIEGIEKDYDIVSGLELYKRKQEELLKRRKARALRKKKDKFRKKQAKLQGKRK